MSERVQNLLSMAALSIAGVAGLFHGTWVFAVVAGCALVVCSLLQRQLAPHMYPTSHRSLPYATIVLASALNASGASAAAFILGRATSWAWGI